MRGRSRLTTVILTGLALAACGQVEPVLMSVSMPECVYSGVSSMREGTARVSLTLNGLGHAGVDMLSLAEGKTHRDLLAHLDGDTAWKSPPPWVSTELELRLDDAQGVDGVEETLTLDEGTYALVCIDFAYGNGEPNAGLAATMKVRDG